MKIKLISLGSVEFQSELKLRNETLRIPLGLNLFNEDLGDETNDYHIGAFLDDILVGIVILTPLKAGEIKMRQLGVREAVRKMNIGKDLVLFAEHIAVKEGFNKIVLNARETVVEFYKKLNYQKVGEMFIEVTIPHYKMEKLI